MAALFCILFLSEFILLLLRHDSGFIKTIIGPIKACESKMNHESDKMAPRSDQTTFGPQCLLWTEDDQVDEDNNQVSVDELRLVSE